MSQRHGDHMGGLTYLLTVNPKVAIYGLKEGFGVHGADLPGNFYRKDPSLPPEQRYYNGAAPEVMRFGSAWPSANFQLVDKNTETPLCPVTPSGAVGNYGYVLILRAWSTGALAPICCRGTAGKRTSRLISTGRRSSSTQQRKKRRFLLRSSKLWTSPFPGVIRARGSKL